MVDRQRFEFRRTEGDREIRTARRGSALMRRSFADRSVAPPLADKIRSDSISATVKKR